MVLPVLLIIAALSAGVFIYQAGIKKEEMVQKQPFPSVVPVETPESTPIPEPKRENLKLRVLNGRGTAGTADKARSYLEGLGYKSIEVDNADSFDFEKTEISIKKDKMNYLDVLKEDLSSKYVISEEVENLDAESEFDAVVIIGKK